MARLNFKVELENGGALGPGKIRLLENIEQKGSIRRAAAAMGMSYRRAWLLLHEVEDMMGASVFAPETGGRRGGGTALTAVGRAVVGHYRSIEARATRAIAADLRALARLAKSRAPSPKRKRGAKKKR